MRRALLCLVLCGCFGEPEPDDHILGTTVAMTTGGEESSSSSAEESSGDGESSSTGEPDPRECPEWCNNGCDLIGGLYAECRCTQDQECASGGFDCDRPSEEIGHCR